MANIEYLFPKSVLIADNVNIDELDLYKTKIYDIFAGAGLNKNEFLGVDSTHTTHNKLHIFHEFANLVESIYFYTSLYLSNMGYDKETITKFKIREMWANRSFKGETLQTHVHPNSLISGAYYVESTFDEKIFFSDFSNNMPEPKNFTESSMNIRWYGTNSSRLLLFKSDMPHGTTKQISDHRITISFNIS